VLAHRGKLERVNVLEKNAPEWTLIFCLRIAVLLHRVRDDQVLPSLSVGFTKTGFHLKVADGRLDLLPLTAAALMEEAKQWLAVGGELKIDAKS
jgi:exopolyphosphatase/guanosine-5'-triphosphate,3'-diphosphate pyrophosphatase